MYICSVTHYPIPNRIEVNPILEKKMKRQEVLKKVRRRRAKYVNIK